MIKSTKHSYFSLKLVLSTVMLVEKVTLHYPYSLQSGKQGYV